MKENYKPVHCHVYDPTHSLFKAGANDKAYCTTVHCSNSENCGLYKRGECSYLQIIGWSRCPYGHVQKKVGFTKRARKFRSWISDQKENYKDVGFLKSHTNMLAVIGDYVFIPYAHMTMCEEVPFKAKGGFLQNGNAFLPIEYFTTENIIKLIEFKPQALLGGEIKSYQDDLPLFMKHLSEQFPDLFKKVIAKNDKAKKLFQQFSNINRKAKLRSITPNVGKLKDIHGGEWVWDGEVFKSTNSHISFALVGRSQMEEVIIKPKGDPIITISDERQVNKNTEFQS